MKGIWDNEIFNNANNISKLTFIPYVDMGVQQQAPHNCLATAIACVLKINVSEVPCFYPSSKATGLGGQVEMVRDWLKEKYPKLKAVYAKMTDKQDVQEAAGLNRALPECVLFGQTKEASEGHSIVGKYIRAFGSGLFKYIHDPAGFDIEKIMVSNWSPFAALFFVPIERDVK